MALLRTLCIGLLLAICGASTCQFVPTVSAAPAEILDIDANNSSIAFAVKHMLINTVRGKFKEFTGTIEMDPGELTKTVVHVTIHAASIDTGVTKRDDDLKGADFLDVAKFPDLTFSSTHIEKQGEGYLMTGSLTMHGVTKEVKIPFTYNGKAVDQAGKTRVGVSGSLQIDRRDWGISYNKVLDNGGLIVANEVTIQLDVEAKKR
jgi:polyisoprenoid-binding protein YceI